VNHSIISATVSMQALQHKLDILGNDIANINTAGYKKRETAFQELLTGMVRQPDGFNREGRLTPPGLKLGWGSRLTEVRPDLSQGSLQETGNPLDLAIEGNALFEVSASAANNEDRPMWTRNGSFRLQPIDAASSYLVTEQGQFVRNTNGTAVVVPNDRRLVIDAQGRITAYNDRVPGGAPQVIGNLRIVYVEKPQYLNNVGDHLYTVSADNIEDILQAVNFEDPGNEQAVAVHQGFLEQSNVNLSTAMSELINIQRAYQLNSRAIISADTMMSLANQLRG
jgi:flagellar basal-body rod protein FlgG